MAQSGFTPIQLYRSATPGAVPTAGNLAPGELALNTADEKLFFENASGVVVSIDKANGTVTSVNASGGTTGMTFSGGPITTSGTLTLSGTLAVANGGTGTATAFTAGSVVFAGASGVYGQDNANLFWDDTNNRLGIGTSTPTGTLEVSQATTATAAIQITATGGTNPYLVFADALGSSGIAGSSTLYLRAGGTGPAANKVYVLSSGNVGIGAASPPERLTVAGNIRLLDSNNIYWGGTANYVTGSNASNFLALGTNSSERMRIDSSGNVGIGTSVPGAKLDIADNSANTAFRITQTGTGNAFVVEDSASPDASPVIINNDGRLLVGDTVSRTIGGITTSAVQIHSTNSDGFRAGLSAFAWDADATGTVLAAGTIVLNRSASDTTGTATAVVANNCLGSFRWTGADGTGFRPAAGVYSFVDGAVAANSVPGRIVFNTTAVGGTSDTERMRIDSSGNVGIGTTAPGARLEISDASNTPLIVNSGSGADTTRGIAFNIGGANFGRILVPAASGGAMAFWAGASGAAAERMRITSAGNVGINETAPDYRLDVNGTFGFTPGASVTPVDNGDVVFELTNNTTLTVKAKGSDGVVRSGTITLA